ncbi:hypothetical protein ICN15_04385 [Polynucleobacter sp. CS-Odin-A6]|nr:hypothetical protein [Polynucleobacter sp. CS-Odin-A6]
MQARKAREVNGRSPSQQIEHWVRFGKLAEDHSELTPQMLLDILNTNSLKPIRH